MACTRDPCTTAGGRVSTRDKAHLTNHQTRLHHKEEDTGTGAGKISHPKTPCPFCGKEISVPNISQHKAICKKNPAPKVKRGHKRKRPSGQEEEDTEEVYVEV